METGDTRLSRALHASKIPIDIHLSWNPLEKHPEKSAQYWFGRLDLETKSGMLLYLNMRKRSFAIVPASSLLMRLNPIFWRKLIHSLTEDLQCTHYENAISLAIETISHSLTFSDKQASD